MAHDERKLRPVELAVDHVQIRAAHAANANAKEQLTRRRLRDRHFFE